MPTRRLYQYQELALVAVIAAPVAVGDILCSEATLLSQRTFLYQSIAEPVPVPTTAVSLDWFNHLSEPSRDGGSLQYQQLVTAKQPEVFGRFEPLSGPLLRAKRGLPVQEQQFIAFVPAPAAEISTAWVQPFPVPIQPRRFFSHTAIYPSLAFVPPLPEAVTADRWVQPFSVPVQPRRFLDRQAATHVPTITAETVTADKWLKPLSEPIRRKLIADQQSISFVAPVTAAETVTVDKWFRPLSGPSFRKQSVAGQRAVFFVAPVTSEVVTVDKWFQGLSEPSVKQKQGLRAASQQSEAFASVVTPPAVEVLSLEGALLSQRTLLYQSSTEPLRVVAETITLDKWFKPFTEPVRKRPDFRVRPQVASVVVPAAATDIRYPQLSEPVRSRKFPTSEQQSFTISPWALTQPETVTESRWHRPWSEPVRVKQGLGAHLQRFISFDPFPLPAVTVTEDRWHQAWSEPTRIKARLVGHQGFDPIPVVPFPQHVWSEPVRTKLGLRVGLQQSLAFNPLPLPAGATSIDRWLEAWSEPVRIKRGLNVALQQSFTPSPFPLPEITLVSKWFNPLSEPVRVKQGLRTGDHQYEARQPFPSVVTPATLASWFAWWSEPVRVKVGLKPQLQQSFATDLKPTPPPPFSVDGWHRPFSEPVRFKLGLRAPLQQVFTTDPSFFLAQPVNADRWYRALSEPVRLKVGLKAWHQQFQIWGEPGKDQITISLGAIETPDTMTGVITVLDEANFANVSISEVVPRYANVSSAYAVNDFADVSIIEV